ncbi:hypothetical protein [Anaplasma bovis]|uniref:hypothetical protein n=1 Tax=Anaplasma bovis TaxID=186733 RepID=UPI002FF1D5A5
MTNYDKVRVSVQVSSNNILEHLDVDDGYITIEDNNGMLFRSHMGCKPEPLMEEEHQCCQCLTVLHGQESLGELQGSSLESLNLDFEDNYMTAHFYLTPEHALTLVDMVSPNIGIDILH